MQTFRLREFGGQALFAKVESFAVPFQRKGNVETQEELLNVSVIPVKTGIYKIYQR